MHASRPKKTSGLERGALEQGITHVRWWVRRHLNFTELRGVLLWAGLIGLAGALVTIGFREAIHFVQYLITGDHGSFVKVATAMPAWRRALTPVLGSLIAGLILQYGGRLTQGRRQTTDYMEAVTLGDGFLSVRASLVKSTSSLFSISSGGSLGREGAMVQLAAMQASILARFLSFPAAQRRTMVACGAAAGVASAYNAPLAAAVFVSELMIGTIEFETMAPIIVSSVIANTTVHSLMGYAPVYEIPALVSPSPQELVFFLLLGVLAGKLAPVYLWLLKTTAQNFRRLPYTVTTRMVLGGCGLGLISFNTPQVWGNGFSVVNSILHDSWTLQALSWVLILKVLATAITVGSGAVGGVFTPTLFVGATLGSVWGTLCHHGLPQLAVSTTAYTVVGMGAFLAATTRAPLMAILMVFEMTRQYEIMLALMLAAITANYLALPHGQAMYSESLKGPGPKKQSLQNFSLLNLITNRTTPVLNANSTFSDVRQCFVSSPYNHIQIVSDQGQWLGVIERSILTSHHSSPTTAAHLLSTQGRYLTSSMKLEEAIQTAAKIPSELMPLVEAGSLKFLGTIAKSELLSTLRYAWRGRTT